MTGDWTGATDKVTRAVPPSWQEWVPLPYMERAATFLMEHRRAGLPLKPGGRKTSITLSAFTQLQTLGKARTMLLVAPLRVCRQVWPQEAAKWEQFRHLRFAFLHGAKKKETWRRTDVDVFLINYEGLSWLATQFFRRSTPIDVVCFDELSMMQNPHSQRSDRFRPCLKNIPFIWGLTGSLFAKGHIGIFGQQLTLDGGAALGKYITHYRNDYFYQEDQGKYVCLPGAEQKIAARIAPYWFYMDKRDYAQLPPLVNVERRADMSAAERKVYQEMKNKMVALLPDGSKVAGVNAGAVYSKLAQMANGAVYVEDEIGAPRRTVKLHDLKLDMLEELLDELDGEPLLVGYEFQSDLARIQERFDKRFGGRVPWLGKGVTDKQEAQWIEQWNRRELPLLLAHPQSAGHGLNMQEGQAYNVAWFSVSWDWELFDQFIRRVRRSGNNTDRIFCHLLIVNNTIDELKLAAVRTKDFTEHRLINALNTELLGDSSNTTETGEVQMVAKLSRSASAPGWGPAPTAAPAAPTPPAQAAQQAPAAPAGWGQAAPQQAPAAPAAPTPAVWGTPAQAPQQAAPAPAQAPAAPAGWGQAAPQDTAEAAQRAAVAAKLTQTPEAPAFDGAIPLGYAGEAAAAAIASGDYGAVAQPGAGAPSAAPAPEKPKRTRRAKVAPVAQTPVPSLEQARAERAAEVVKEAPVATTGWPAQHVAENATVPAGTPAVESGELNTPLNVRSQASIATAAVAVDALVDVRLSIALAAMASPIARTTYEAGELAQRMWAFVNNGQ